MERKLTEEISNHNFIAFIWHGIFLSLASNFMDIHTIIPSMLIKAGGGAISLGVLTTIMVGGSSIVQIVFAGFISNRKRKKTTLISAISLRVFTLLLLAVILFLSDYISGWVTITAIFILISIFSFSGSYANISYMDILGKSIIADKRKKFFTIKQTVSSIGILLSAFIVRNLLKQYSYPQNYGILLFSAGLLLFIASLGFWRIKEINSKINKKVSLREFIKMIPYEFSQNANIKNYLIIINFFGLAFSLIPFMVLFAKKNFVFSNALIGNILLYKVVGMLLTSLVLFKRSNSFEYKKLLYFSVACGVAMPVLSLIFQKNIFVYPIIFIVSGVFITAFNIAKSGILMEISTDENRALYTGISGAGYILPTIFPLMAGVMITTLGYNITFISIALIVASGLFFIRKLNCK